jgi:hypothetical protein
MELLVIAGIVLFFYWRRQKKKQRLTNDAFQNALGYANAINAAPDLQGDGSFSQEVVGESFYGKDFKKLETFIKQVDPGEDEVVCILVADPQNKHDKNAVRVMAGDLQLGHLPRETAAEVQSEIIELGGLAKVIGKVHFGTHNSLRLDMVIPLKTKV